MLMGPFLCYLVLGGAVFHNHHPSMSAEANSAFIADVRQCHRHTAGFLMSAAVVHLFIFRCRC